jgi:hypothetical protein
VRGGGFRDGCYAELKKKGGEQHGRTSTLAGKQKEEERRGVKRNRTQECKHGRGS